MSTKGMQMSLKGVQLLQGGAVTTRGCSCLNCTNQVNYTFCSVGQFGWSVRLVSSVGQFGWSVRLVHLRQVHPLKAPPESHYSKYCTFSATYNE